MKPKDELLQQAEKELSRKESDLKETERKIFAIAKEEAKHAENLQRIKGDELSLAEMVSSLKSKAESLKNEVKVLEAKKEDLSLHVDFSLDSLHKALIDDSNQIKNEIRELTEQKENIKLVIEKAVKLALEDERAAINTKNNELSNYIRVAKNTADEAERRLNELKADYQKTVALKAELNSQISKNNEKEDALNTRASSLERSIDDYKSKLAMLTAKEENLNKIVKDNEQKKDYLAGREVELNALSHNLEIRENAVSKNLLSLSEKEKIIIDKEAKIDIAQKSIDSDKSALEMRAKELKLKEIQISKKIKENRIEEAIK